MAAHPDTYDVVVIGGGTAGSNAARAARQAGAERILLVHLPELLNTCAERGCMPSKSMISSSERGGSFADALALMDRHIDRLAEGLEATLHSEFEIIEGRAGFLPEGTGLSIKSGDGERTVRARSYVVAVGSQPVIPPIAGLDAVPERSVLTSDSMVSHEHIRELPASIFILGGGPIGLEMMTVFSRFNVPVTLAERGELLSHMDPEFGKELRHAIEAKENITVLTGANLARVDTRGSELVFTVERRCAAGAKEEFHAERLLVSTGRAPALDSLHLERAGLTLERGRVRFNERTLQSENPHIYIAGDATGMHQILHYASAMGKIAGYNAAVGEPEREMDYEAIKMGVIFSDPQIAQVGLTEGEAKERNIDAVSSTLELPHIGRGLLENHATGLWKLTVERKSGCIIGAQAIGPSPHSEWFVDTAAWLMYFKGTAEDIAKKAPYYHPTWPELFQSLGRDLCRQLKIAEDDTLSAGMP